ncbi:MAG: NAD(P)/FAD-dependent oxidoreductase, partial [Silvibacterium sp.]
MTPEEILDVFNVPHETMKNVYLLGSFARRVTLYSQQVRALNLIYALHKTKKFEKGSKVVVVGAGAAGLMAAAAAAELEASVTLLEQLQGPMELQRNSRIRWIDPFIYDWPITESAGTRANLPVIDWKAGYAEK